MNINLNYIKSVFEIDFFPKSVSDQLTNLGLEVESFDKKANILDIAITPNRGDCFSHLGIARELSINTSKSKNLLKNIILSKKVRFKKSTKKHIGVNCFYSAEISLKTNNSVSSEYSKIKNFLVSLGHRSINPVVDITNYVMLLLGQPMHAYDAQKVTGEITSAINKSKTELTLIDNKNYLIDKSFLTIRDDKNILGLAGIMGGKFSEVSKKTSTIILESANFNASFIRGKTRMLNLNSDASMRFEREVDVNITKLAFLHAIYLLEKICGAEVNIANQFEINSPLTKIIFNPDDANNQLGTNIKKAEILRILKNIGVTLRQKGKVYEASIPSWRNDIKIEADLIEEVARVYGYNKIDIDSNQPASKFVYTNQSIEKLQNIRRILINYGFNECKNLSLVSNTLANQYYKNPIQIINPINKEFDTLRPSILLSLIKNAEYNSKNVLRPLKIFEQGTIFNTNKKKTNESHSLAAIIGIQKEKYSIFNHSEVILNQLLINVFKVFTLNNHTLELSNHPLFDSDNSYCIHLNNKEIGYIGVISPSILNDKRINLLGFELNIASLLGVDKPLKYKSISRFPSVRRDISIQCGPDVSVHHILNTIDSLGNTILQERFIFDYFEDKSKKGKKSIGLGLILQSKSSSLLDNEIDLFISNLKELLKKSHNIEYKE